MGNKTLEKTISWKEFQSRKHEERKEILKLVASRIEEGHDFNYNLDLDIVPLVNTWDDIPFSFTIDSCSGTPKEHGWRKGYGHYAGLETNPNAALTAHSYIAHPLFERFKIFLEESLSEKADLSKSNVHGLEGYEGIYLHSISVWVPEEIKQSGDLKYLDKFWKDFHNNLKEFISDYRYRPDWTKLKK